MNGKPSQLIRNKYITRLVRLPNWLPHCTVAETTAKKSTPALGACKSRQIFFCEIDWSYLCVASVWQILHFAKTNFADIRQKDILTLDGLEKGQLIQLDDVTRIKLALRNQGQLAPFVCYLVFKIGNFAIDITEQKKILSNYSKQLVTPVNLTRKKFHKLFNFQDWERAPKAK